MSAPERVSDERLREIAAEDGAVLGNLARELVRRRAADAEVSAETLEELAEGIEDAHVWNWELFTYNDPPTGALQAEKRILDAAAAFLRSLAESRRG